jgi:L-alanine-DL-glutamate epimerase-like enolase superfamily enzyme
VSTFDKLAGLAVEVDGYELEGLEFPITADFTRLTTVIRIQGGGMDGIGEDVTYDGLDHVALQDAGPVHDLMGKWTLGELCELIGSVDLFPAEPVREPSRLYRRWAFESAALDLALRQAGEPLHAALGREPRPLSFVVSPRLAPPEEGARSSLDPVRRRLEKYPRLRFKLDPTNDWTDELIAGLAELAPVDVLDLKGMYKGTPVDVETDPELYRRVAEAFPEAVLEDPDLNDETQPVLEPHRDRVSWDAPIHSVADIEALPFEPRWLNIKPSRLGGLRSLLDTYDYCEREGIRTYGGGQFELGPGRGHIQYLASLFHSESPNDVAPGGHNDPAIPDGLPEPPLAPASEHVGFRWAGEPMAQ